MYELTEELLLEKSAPYLRTLRKIYEKTGKKDLMYKGKVDAELEKEIIFEKRKAPMNTNINVHNIANKWFYDNFGVAARTDTVFATTDKTMTKNYGITRIFVPIGKFSFICSPKYRDMYLVVDEEEVFDVISKSMSSDALKETEKLLYVNRGAFFDFLKDNHYDLLESAIHSILEQGDYSKNKISAFTSGNELMVKCDSYMLLPLNERFISFFDEFVFM